MNADNVIPAYQNQHQTNNTQAPPQQQLPPGASQAATYYDNNVSYDDSRQRQQPPPAVQQQYYQPPPFEKPNINIRPLLETGPPNPGQHVSEFPTVGFSGNNNDNTNPTSDYALNGKEEGADIFLSSSTRRMNLRYQLFLDSLSPHLRARWVFSLLALGVFIARVVLSQGWYVICYALSVYYLNLLIGFISPRVDPSLAPGDDEDNGPMLPTHANDEFKPFMRRVPEFKFWISGTNATLIALFMTLFDIFDVPVFWPILLIYFVILTACTTRQQIRHMIRYSYVPWDSGKKKYVGSGGSTLTNI